MPIQPAACTAPAADAHDIGGPLVAPIDGTSRDGDRHQEPKNRQSKGEESIWGSQTHFTDFTEAKHVMLQHGKKTDVIEKWDFLIIQKKM